MPCVIGTLLILAIGWSPVTAGDLPPIAFLSMGYSEVTPQMLTGTPHADVRKADAAGFLSVSADFNGDGKADEARILFNSTRRDAMVVAVIEGSDKVDTYVLQTMPLAYTETVGIKVKACRSGRPGLLFFAFDGGAELQCFDGEEFGVEE